MTEIYHDAGNFDRYLDRTTASLYQALPGLLNLRRELGRHSTNQVGLFGTPEQREIDEVLVRVMHLLRGVQSEVLLEDRLVATGVISQHLDMTTIARMHHDREITSGKELSIPIPVVGIVGDMGSGKETVGEVLAIRFNFRNFPVSERLREVAATQVYLQPYARNTLWEVNEQFAERFGEEVWTRWTLDMIARMYQSQQPLSGASIDGIRILKAAQYLKSRPNTLLLGVFASPDIRYQRILSRARQGDTLTREAFDERDQIENDQMVSIMEQADIIFTNEGSKKELETNVIGFMEQFIRETTK